jgi:hypothetical protein
VQCVLDSGMNTFVDGVEVVFPARQGAAVTWCAIGHDHLGIALLATVGHHRGAVALLIDLRVAVGPAVVAVSCGATDRSRPPPTYDQPATKSHRRPVTVCSPPRTATTRPSLSNWRTVKPVNTGTHFGRCLPITCTNE